MLNLSIWPYRQRFAQECDNTNYGRMEQRPGVGFFKGRAHNGVAPVHCLQTVIRLFCLAHVVQKNFPWRNSFSISQPDVTDMTALSWIHLGNLLILCKFCRNMQKRNLKELTSGQEKVLCGQVPPPNTFLSFPVAHGQMNRKTLHERALCQRAREI